MQLIITITDDNQLAGLAAARDLWNAANPDAQLASDEDYLLARIDDLLSSYAQALAAQKKADALAALEAGDTAPMQALISDMQVQAVGGLQVSKPPTLA